MYLPLGDFGIMYLPLGHFGTVYLPLGDFSTMYLPLGEFGILYRGKITIKAFVKVYLITDSQRFKFFIGSIKKHCGYKSQNDNSSIVNMKANK